MSREEFPEMLGTHQILILSTKWHPYQLSFRDRFWNQRDQIPVLNELRPVLHAYGEVEQRYVNQVYLDPLRTDQYGVPEIGIRFSFSERDKAVIRQMAPVMIQAASAIGARLDMKDGVPDICLTLPGRLHHDTGTCRMGNNPRDFGNQPLWPDSWHIRSVCGGQQRRACHRRNPPNT